VRFPPIFPPGSLFRLPLTMTAHGETRPAGEGGTDRFLLQAPSRPFPHANPFTEGGELIALPWMCVWLEARLKVVVDTTAAMGAPAGGGGEAARLEASLSPRARLTIAVALALAILRQRRQRAKGAAGNGAPVGVGKSSSPALVYDEGRSWSADPCQLVTPGDLLSRTEPVELEDILPRRETVVGVDISGLVRTRPRCSTPVPPHIIPNHCHHHDHPVRHRFLPPSAPSCAGQTQPPVAPLRGHGRGGGSGGSSWHLKNASCSAPHRPYWTGWTGA
jgi:hypothetical protein